MNPLLNQRAMLLFSFDHAVTFVAYTFLFTLQMTTVSSQPKTGVLAYGHSGVYCKCIPPAGRTHDQHGACPQSPFTAIREGPSGFNIFLLPVYPEALCSSTEALLRAGLSV